MYVPKYSYILKGAIVLLFFFTCNYNELSHQSPWTIFQPFYTVTLYQTTEILNLSKLKGFADEDINFNSGSEILVGKDRKLCWFPAFSSFPIIF